MATHCSYKTLVVLCVMALLLALACAGSGSVEEDNPVRGYTEGARVYHDAGQTIPNDTYTSLAFNSERYDTDTIHDPVTNNSRLTCRTTGKYIICFNGYFAENTTGTRLILFMLNSTTVIACFEPGAVTGTHTRIPLCTIYDLSVDDYVEAQVWQNSGGDLSILSLGNRSPEFMMQRIG